MRTRSKKAAQRRSRARLIDHVARDTGAIAERLAPAFPRHQAFVMQAIQNLGRGGVNKLRGLTDVFVDVTRRRSAKLPELRENRVLQIATRKTKPLHRLKRTTLVVDGQPGASPRIGDSAIPYLIDKAGWH